MEMQLVCENKLCFKSIPNNKPRVAITRKLTLDSENVTHYAIACSWSCLVTIIMEFVKIDSDNQEERISGLLSRLPKD